MSPRMGLTKEKIMETAEEIADRNGIESVTIANLAKALNIRPPSLYNHIKGLNELRKVLAVHSLDHLHSHLKSAIGNKSRDEAVQALGASYMDFSRKHPGLYEAALHSPDPGDRDVQEAGNRIVVLALETIGYLKLAEEDSLHAVRGLRSMLHGFASLEQKRGFGIDLSVDQSLQMGIDVFLTGLQQKKNVK